MTRILYTIVTIDYQYYEFIKNLNNATANLHLKQEMETRIIKNISIKMIA